MKLSVSYCDHCRSVQVAPGHVPAEKIKAMSLPPVPTGIAPCGCCPITAFYGYCVVCSKGVTPGEVRHFFRLDEGDL
jgi:hypothetical protein